MVDILYLFFLVAFWCSTYSGFWKIRGISATWSPCVYAVLECDLLYIVMGVLGYFECVVWFIAVYWFVVYAQTIHVLVDCPPNVVVHGYKQSHD